MSLIPLSALSGPRSSAAEREAQARQERRDAYASLWPHAALIYIENRCHLKCAHCYESEVSHPPHLQENGMSLDDYKKLFDELAELGVITLTLSGGEIFLRRDVFDIIREARARRFRVCLFTSGTHIDEKKADKLAELGVGKVEITVYSHIPEVHDKFTGSKGSQARSVRALRLLKARGINTALKANLMTFNVDHLDGLVELADGLGATWAFDPTVKPKMDNNRDPLRFALSPDQIRRKVLNRPELFKAFRKEGADAYCDGTAHITGPEQVICGAARTHFAVAADGGVLACGFFPVEAGNVKDRPLKEIWLESAQLDNIRKTTFDKMTACQGCEVKNTCHPCMAYSVVENDGDHTGCATSSRQLGEAVALQAAAKVKKDAQMARGKALPLSGDIVFTPPPQRGEMTTE